MPITYKVFTTHLNPGGFHKHGIHAIPKAHTLAVRFYCNVLALRGACSMNCSQCILNVKTQLNTAKWDENHTGYGLYIFILKSAAAKAVEQAHGQKEAKAQNEFHEPVETDGLDLLLETLS